MISRIEHTIRQFKGYRNDEDSKQIPIEWFFKAVNYQFPKTGTKGLDKCLMPEQVQQIGTSAIDGGFEYRFLDQSNVLQTQNISVTGGTIYSTDLTNTPTALKTGLTAGKVTFAAYKDKLFIANGQNYIQVYDGTLGVVNEMGAPAAELTGTAGNVNEGTHYYAMTYVTAGGEQILGSVSNTVSVVVGTGGKQVVLHLPTGYAGTVTRNIYRTAAGGTELKLLVSGLNNTDLTYTDNLADNVLAGDIPPINNELPKPYIIAVHDQMLYGTCADLYPTQMWATEADLEVINVAKYIDISNYADDDNTAVEGMGVDFGKIIIMSGKNVFIDDYDVTTATHAIKQTRAGVGCKNRYSVKRVPAFGDFPGGLMFLSSVNDIRCMSGMPDSSLPVSTVIDNIRTENWGQPIRGDLEREIKVLANVCAEYFDYKYMLTLNYITYMFDIRMQGWTSKRVQSASYLSQPQVMFILGNLLYNGQPDGWIEQEFSKIQYRSEDVESYLQTAHIAVEEKFKILESIKLWFVPSMQNQIQVTVYTDDNNTASDELTFTVLANGSFRVKGGVFDSRYFSPVYFNTDDTGMDYRTLNINKTCRWFRFELRNTVGNISFQGYTLVGQGLKNSERGTP